ncbi:52 kDa repressor of the inhibitor of the protein kinase-like isoform X2 [Odontomachus brunneus]|uniref:52 kDa repressor of the inhibitor of the protein kinase-like isoform X2 n=1 Tax=Odontomachus brunneus TaxID=486640 RepID=UPI0013F1CBBA|nr:52 kDa repressor of the inhibitor of the protein kinase-like isoform X2 [Odontomachus brunneus]
MPSCYIKNCTNRIRTKSIKFFQFPKEPAVLQQWLKACGKNEEEIISNSATICSLHFTEDCFQMVWTKMRQKNIPAKQILRLKKNSIPTKLLNMEKKRKRLCKNDKGIKIVHTGIPSYGELVQYVREKQYIANSPEQTTYVDTNIHKDEHILLSNNAVKETTHEDIGCETNASVQTLLKLLRKSEEKKQLLKEKNQLLIEKNQLLIENNQLLTEKNQLLIEKNELLTEKTKLIEQNNKLIDNTEKLNLQLALLKKNMQQESNITQMEIDKLKETEIKADVLHKYFTPRQQQNTTAKRQNGGSSFL